MKACVQRVSRAAVRVDGETTGAVGEGLMVLLGVLKDDDVATARRLAGRVARLRVLRDERDRMQHGAVDRGAGVLVVSQITLAWEGTKGHRPSFDAAAGPSRAEELYRVFCDALRELGVEVAEGVFGARMEVELVNDGPVTMMLEERPSD